MWNEDKFISITFMQLRHVRLSVVWHPWCRMNFKFYFVLCEVLLSYVASNEVLLWDLPSQLHLVAKVKECLRSLELNLRCYPRAPWRFLSVGFFMFCMNRFYHWLSQEIVHSSTSELNLRWLTRAPWRFPSVDFFIFLHKSVLPLAQPRNRAWFYFRIGSSDVFHMLHDSFPL